MKITPSNWNLQPQLTRRSILRGAPAAALALTASTATAFQGPVPAEPDPLPGWFDRWKKTTASLIEEAHKPGAGDMDTPECLAFMEERDWLEGLIINTPPRTPAGAAAQIEYAMEDMIAGDYFPDGKDGRMFRGIVDMLKVRAV